jgi:L-ribulokinase
MSGGETFTVGVDFGTNSVRAVVVSSADGRAVGTSVFDYPSGEEGVLLHPKDPHLARQNPADYMAGLGASVVGALAEAERDGAFSRARVIGIGADTTGSTPIPIDAHAQPLAINPRWQHNLAAQAWLWKDHTAADEAAAITETAARHAPHLLAPIGGTYSSEWWWSKIWHCLNVAPDVFDAAASWVELADFVPAVLAGVASPRDIVRCVCAAGHKAMYLGSRREAEACREDGPRREDASPREEERERDSRREVPRGGGNAGGLPSKAFLARLDPRLADLRDRLYDVAHPPGAPAGRLARAWADTFGLPEGIVVAMGGFDAHYAAVGAGICPGTLVKIIGTSTCDCAIVPAADPEGSPLPFPAIPGICGIVNGSIMPGYFGIEAGQSAVGDLLKWWVERVCLGGASLHDDLSREAAALGPGQSGLLALDWNNGNRTILVDPRLTGLIVGQTLHTTRAEIYRALIEATAFGARAILERLRDCGVAIDRVVCCGGIAAKNDLFLQMYADVLGQPMLVARSAQAPALGAAISAAVTAGSAGGGYDDWHEAQRKMTAVEARSFLPEPGAAALYNELYRLYRELHDGFGGVPAARTDLGSLMKRLMAIRQRA